MRFFAYIWSYLANQARNRTTGTTDGVARENGEQVYRENIHYHGCRDIYKQEPRCIDCNIHETISDLHGIEPSSYSPSERIIGDLEELGWMIVRDMIIDEPTFKDIKGIACMGCTSWGGTSYPVQGDGSQRLMKYKHTSTVHKEQL